MWSRGHPRGYYLLFSVQEQGDGEGFVILFRLITLSILTFVVVVVVGVVIRSGAGRCPPLGVGYSDQRQF